MSTQKYGLELVGIDKTSGPLKHITAAAGDLAGQYKALEGRKNALDDLHKDVVAYKKSGRALEGLTKDLSDAKRETEHLAREMNSGNGATRKQERAFERSQKRVQRLQKETNALATSSNKLGNELKAEGIDTKRLADEQNRLERVMRGATRQVEEQRREVKRLTEADERHITVQRKLNDRANRRVSSRTSDLAGADTRVGETQSKLQTAAIVAASVALPVWRAEQAETAMANVAKVVNFKDDAEKNTFQQDLHRQAASTNTSFEDAAAIAEAAGQSNIAKDEILAFTASATKMGVAFDMGAGAAGETMAAWRAGMGLTQEATLALADSVNHVSNNMNAKAADISQVLKRQGAVALKSGLSEQQTASLAGSLLSGGATAEIASTTLKNLLGALTKGDAATGAQQNVMNELGFDPEQVASMMQSDAPGTMIAMFEALADAPIEKQSALISQLFGEESKGGIVPLLGNLDGLRRSFELTSEAAKYNGAMEAEYAGLAQTTAYKRGAGIKQLDRLAVVLGGALLPATSAVSEVVGAAAGALADFATEHEAATKLVVLGGTALGAFAVAKMGFNYLQAKRDQHRARTALARAEISAASSADRLARSLRGAAGAMNATSAASMARGRRAGASTGAVAGNAVAGAAMMGGAGGASSVASAGKYAKYAKFGGVAGSLAMGALVLAPMVMGESDPNQTNEEKGEAIGGVTGALAGAAAGAAIGSIVPVIGTAIGGIVGGILGSFGGDYAGTALGGEIGSWFDDDKDQLEKPTRHAMPAGMQNAIGPGAVFQSTVKIENLPPTVSAEEVAQLVVEKQKTQIMPAIRGPRGRIDLNLGGT